ncbi:pyridoxal phosphate-dependent aminotransferase [Roseibium album]|uniref:pyridoxal phosphate-dependent aminotransferase n=1 Tax=Roseibium album TaxID=311410 RepID=UPI0039195BAF
MEVGQPSTSAPAIVLDAATDVIRCEKLGYTVAAGIPELRQAIAGHYTTTYQFSVDPDQVIVTPGSSGGFVLAFLTAFEPGARVALAEPGYPCYRNILTASGIEVVSIPCGPESRYQITPTLLESVAGPIDGLVIASPSNPTGSMISALEMEALVNYCDSRNIVVVSDEIYHGIEFGTPAASAAQYSDRAIVVNSFSKYFSMTGWRVGWMLLPPKLVRNAEKLMQNLFISAASVSQYAAIAAFDAHNELQGHVSRYRENRNIILKGLEAAHVNDFAPPDGAFYVYADMSEFTANSVNFCSTMIEETGIAATPGVDFDPIRGPSMIRFSYSGDTRTVIDAMTRFAGYLDDLRANKQCA